MSYGQLFVGSSNIKPHLSILEVKNNKTIVLFKKILKIKLLLIVVFDTTLFYPSVSIVILEIKYNLH